MTVDSPPWHGVRPAGRSVGRRVADPPVREGGV